MSTARPDRDSDARRQMRYEVNSKRTQYIGAGFGGLLLLLGTGGILNDAPAVFPPLIVTFIAIGAVCNGIAYANYLVGASLLKAALADELEGKTVGNFDHVPHLYNVAGMISGTFAGLLMIIGAWIGAFA